MRRIFGRIWQTSARELRFRGAERVRVAHEAVRYLTGGARWRRERLRSRLVGNAPDLQRAAAALARRDWARADASLREHFLTRSPRFVLDPADRPRLTAAIRDRFPSAAEDAAARAARVLDGRYDLLGFEGLSFSEPGGGVDWHYDPVLNGRAPTRFWALVPYLDARYGDHKIIWELNRHQHWLALGRAAWLTGDGRYAAACARELESWLQANPPLAGINWCSMLELSFRSLSWIWALHFLLALEHGGTPGVLLDLLVGLERQLEHVARHLSFYFSPNTHLLGEALALYVGGRTFPELRQGAHWEKIGRAVLIREAHIQVRPDGSHAEGSPHYHRYALDFYLLALAVARRTADPAAGEFAEVAGRLSTFCRAIAGDEGRLPLVGDDDGGMLFPICGRSPDDVRDTLALAAGLLDRPDLAVAEPPEEIFWMLGPDGASVVPHPRAESPAAGAQLFPDSGYAVLDREGHHAVLDAGPHGFLNAGHAHSDALAFTLSVNGRPLLIDPGTASYTVRELRDRFRSTRMHNTVVVDGRPQSVPAGPFSWISSADGRVSVWRPYIDIPGARDVGRGEDAAGRDEAPAPFDYVEALHDGYMPLVHRRAVLSVGNGLWLVADDIIGQGRHGAEVYWHLDPGWGVESDSEAAVSLRHGDGLHGAIASTARSCDTYSADANGLGWCAPRYGRIVPCTTVRHSHTADTPFSVVTALAATATPVRLTIRALALTTGGGSECRDAAVAVQYNDTRLIALFAASNTAEPGEHPGACERRVAVDGVEFATDARVALLRLRPSGAPRALGLIEGTFAAWTGEGAFVLPASAQARELHLSESALQRLSHRTQGQLLR